MVQGEHYYIQWDNEWLPTSTINFQWIINSCEVRVEGKVYRDLNSNAVRDEGEPLYQAILDRDGQEQFTYANTDPYLMCSTTGEHTITVTNPPLYYNIVPETRTYNAVQMNSFIDSMDFALQPIPGMFDGRVSLWGVTPWIGNNTVMQIEYENIGTEPIDAMVELHLDDQLEFASSPVTPVSVNGPLVIWDLGTLAVGEHGTIPVTIYTPPTVAWGYQTLTWVLLNVDQPDVNGIDNIDELKLPTVASWDPNDKQVDLVNLLPEEVAEQKFLEYTIRFQNTGDAPAVNVVVRDTLPEELDITSFQMVGATHDHVISMNGREIVWTFPNIMLPDSTTDPEGSIGAFHFRARVNDDLLLGDQVTNEAHIYFDLADPIITNTVVTTVSLTTGIGLPDHSDPYVLLHPSPTRGPLTVRWLGDAASDVELVITDAVGRIIFSRTIGSLVHMQEIPLDLHGSAPGNYMLRLSNGEVNARARFMVQY